MLVNHNSYIPEITIALKKIFFLVTRNFKRTIFLSEIQKTFISQKIRTVMFLNNSVILEIDSCIWIGS